ncbi:unnamed protein product [Durusdinium trenchii]|uniref:Alpha-type protein kinase domain-containing protein n=1 Tax=Durusdinium trenchii TaxID=1381693 RepID=A0ABP0PZI7_9DINO
MSKKLLVKSFNLVQPRLMSTSPSTKQKLVPVSDFRALIPIREIHQENYLDDSNDEIYVDISNKFIHHAGIYKKEPHLAHVYTHREQVKERYKSKRGHIFWYTAELKFEIRWNQTAARWEHRVERHLIEEDTHQIPEQWGVIEQSLYSVNESGHEGNPVEGEWQSLINEEEHQDTTRKRGSCPGIYATAWSHTGFWKALVAAAKRARGEVTYEEVTYSGPTCHIIFIVDSSKSMAKKDLKLDGQSMRRIDGAFLMMKEFAQNDPGHGSDTYTAVLVSEMGCQTICKQSPAAILADCLESVDVEPKHGASYRRVIDSLRTLSDVRERTRVIFLSDARPGDAGPYLKYYCEYLSWLGANSQVLPLDTLQVYTIGMQGTSDFAILQQMAHLGNGMHLPCQSSIASLRTAFATVSRTITQRRKAVGSGQSFNDFAKPTRNNRKERSQFYELPGLITFGHKNCKLLRGKSTEFVFDGSEFLEKVQEHVEVSVHNLPFDRGAMRWTDETYGIKEARRDVKSLALASFLALEFCTFCDLQPEKFRFVRSSIYQCHSEDSWGLTADHVFVGEEHLNTRFIKFSSNDGFVNYIDHSLEAQAFVHFTYEACGEEMMVSDIQGVRVDNGILLTDPQILSSWHGFGPGDLGAGGMSSCMESHECNYLCQRFTKKFKAQRQSERMPGSWTTLVDPWNLAEGAETYS